MRILHIETGRHFYGGARQVAYLVDALAARGVDNRLLCCPGHRLLEIVTRAEVVAMPFGGDLDFGQQRRVERAIADFRPDLVHVHSRRGADLFGGLAARAAGRPAVLTRRVQSNEPGVWLRYKCRPYRAVVAISKAVLDELSAARVPGERLHRIASAVDTTTFRPDPGARRRLLERFDLPEDAFIAGAAAQFVVRKGQDSLLGLAARLVPERPELRLLLFGRGPTRARLERQVLRLGLERAVRFCGFVDEWPALLPGLDLLLHPARREGLGAVVLEAMSAGVPVVASAVGGIVDVIESGRDGVLLPAAAADVWLAAVRDLMRDTEARARLAAAAQARVAREFGVERMAGAYLDLYRQIYG